MPIYEYQCRNCQQSSQFLILKKEEEDGILCPGCSSNQLKRIISRVAYHPSQDDRIMNFNPDSRQTESFYSDSRNIGLSAQKQAREMGVDLGKSFEDKLEKLRSDPGSILKDSSI